MGPSQWGAKLQCNLQNWKARIHLQDLAMVVWLHKWSRFGCKGSQQSYGYGLRPIVFYPRNILLLLFISLSLFVIYSLGWLIIPPLVAGNQVSNSKKCNDNLSSLLTTLRFVFDVFCWRPAPPLAATLHWPTTIASAQSQSKNHTMICLNSTLEF